MIARLEELLENITSHPAVDNSFYREWMSRSMNIDELEIFARNYGAWVKSFPDALAVLIQATADVEAKTEYVKTLYSEMGYGDPAKTHAALLDDFYEKIAKKLGQESRLSREVRERKLPMLRTTCALIAGEQELYRDALRSVGAQLALEWQAYTMLRKLYDGARNYLPLWSNPDEFHEACEYFYIHIGAAEKDHKEESLNAVRRYAVNDVSLALIIEGYNRHLDLIADFWEGISRATAEIMSGHRVYAGATRHD